jgi:pimeloyl-ACP methyl ester carboxylesterase
MAMKLSDRAPWLFNAMFSAGGFYARHRPQSFIKYLKKMTNESGYQLFEDERIVDVFGKTQQESYAQGGKGVAEDARVHYRDWGFRLEQIAMPIHIFHGTLDQLVPFAFGEHLVNNAPGASLHRFVDLGHLFPAMPEYQRQIFTTAKSAMT